MKKLKKFLTPGVTAVLFVLAVLLLGTSAVNGTRAALTYRSETYTAQIEMFDIGVTLQESNGEEWYDVSWRNYVANSNDDWDEDEGVLLGERWQQANDISEEAPIKLGMTYPEGLRVRNSGTIDQYVRVSVYKYWYDAETGKKLPALDPKLIDLHFVTGNGWSIDESSSTDERTVLYYSPKLPANAGGASISEPFTDTLTVSPDVQLGIKSHEEVQGNVIKTVYEYNGIRFEIKAVVDAVQDHNAPDAKLSSWGVSY